MILDTHVWICLLSGDDKIIEYGYLNIINEHLQKYEIKIPSICLWEFCMLENKKRITLKENALLWLKRALSAPGISIYPLTPEIAYESSNLPGIFHGDPADRIIVSTVRVSKGSLLTLDKKIHEYSNEGYVNVIFPARKSGSGE